MITGLTALTVLFDVPAGSLTFMLVIGFPMSLLLQLAKNAVTLTLIGGSSTSNFGSWSKHTYSR